MQVELARRLYMDEATLSKNAGFDAHAHVVHGPREGPGRAPRPLNPAKTPQKAAEPLDMNMRFRQVARLRMAKSDITGKRKLSAQNVSHSNIKTKRWQNVNIQTRRVWVPEFKRYVTLNLTTRDIRTIDKIGVMAYAKRHGVKL